MSDTDPVALVEVTSEVVSTYLAQNHVPTAEIPALIAWVHATLVGLGEASKLATVEPDRPMPAVSIRKSVTDESDEYLISLEDGKRYATLRWHLTRLGMTLETYRAKWGLPPNYPIVSPNHSRARPAAAKEMGLGARLHRR